MFNMTLTPCRDNNHERSVTLVRYFREGDTVVPLRYYYVMTARGLVCERITQLRWKHIKRENHMRTIKAPGAGADTAEVAA